MSKNLTRKGLAFGALVALAGSMFAGTPAAADNNGPITLLPNGGVATGATFNSIIGAGITLDAAPDARLANASNGTSPYDDGNKFVYVVKNASGAKITLTLTGTASNAGYAIFNTDGEAVTAESDSANTYAADDNNNSGTTANSLDVDDFNWDGDAKRDATLPFVDASTAGTFVTDATAIVIGANIKPATAGLDSIASLTIDSTGTSTVAVKVQALSDETSADETGFGIVNAFELTSKEETVTLYPISAVSATTTITTLARTASTGTSAVVKTAFGSSVNPHAVSGNTTVSLQKDGTNFAITSQSNAVSAGKVVNTAVMTAAVGSGMYTAQSIFTIGGVATNIGAASIASDLRDGEVASVGTSDAYALSGANLDATTDDMVVRAGTKSVDVIVKNGSPAIEKAGIKYRATVTATKLDATSSATVSGSATKLAATDDVAVAYATSDATGKVTFSINNAGAVKTDKLTLVIDALTTTGAWGTSDTVTLTWAAAALSKVKVLPGTYVSGANPTVTFKTVDQFGEPISSTTNGSLMIKAVAKIAGVTDTTKLNESKTVVNGTVSFTFANFATAAIPGQVFAKLYEGVTASASSITNYESTINVYAVGSVNKISVLDTYTTEVTYADFVTGDETDSAVAAKIEKSGIGAVSGATISGTVLDTAGAGLPGAAVDVASAGVLFYDSVQKIYAADKITVYANEYGAFSVEAIAHKVNTTGAKVTLTAAGTTVSTLLKSYFPTTDADGAGAGTISNKLVADNLKFSWKLPSLMVKNTTYALVAELTDKWGNPVKTATDTTPTPDAYGVTFQGFGSLQVNSLDTEVYKNFDKTGKVTVFIRSVKDIAGPGSLSATLGNASFTAGTATVLQIGTLTASTTDSTATAWDETSFSDVLSASVDILEKAPTASISKGSKSSTVVVKNANGTTVKVVRGSKAVTKVATSNSYKVTLKGGTGAVKVYVNGVKVASK